MPAAPHDSSCSQTGILWSATGADKHHELARVVSEFVSLLCWAIVAHGSCSTRASRKERSKGVALVIRHGHETPRKELAVIRRSRGNSQHAFDLGLGWPRIDELARLGGTAGLEKREDR